MIGVGLVAGLVLVSAGATLAGTVIAGLAVLRGVVMLTMQRRMSRRAPGHGGGRSAIPPSSNLHASGPASQSWADAVGATGSPPAASSDPMAAGWAAPTSTPGPAAGTGARGPASGGTGARPLQRLARRELGVAASTIGVDAAELRRQRGIGRSIADVARDHGVAVDRVVNAVMADARTVIERARRNGNPAVVGVDTSEARLTTWVTRFVEQRGAPDPSG